MYAVGTTSAARRIDATYSHDAFCTIDEKGRRGLRLIGDRGPVQIPTFDAITIAVSPRSEDQVSIEITLLTENLATAFISVCDGLLGSCRNSSRAELLSSSISYLVQANALLEFGDPLVLGSSKLRGLLGELIMLSHLLPIKGIAESVHSWIGPDRAPQDFAFSDCLFEVKAKTPTRNTVTISSIDQLDVIDNIPLILAVVTLSQLQDGLEGGVSPNDLVNGVRQSIATDAVASTELELKLRTCNYFPRPYYSNVKYRLISMRYFRVHDGFPKLRRCNLARGILDATYELDLSQCEEYETILETAWN